MFEVSFDIQDLFEFRIKMTEFDATGKEAGVTEDVLEKSQEFIA